MDAVPINAMSEILPPVDGKGGLYLGNIIAAKHLHHLNKFKITAMLSLIDGTKFFKHPEEILQHQILIDDTPEYNILQHFDFTSEFIQKHLETTNVLVHCYAGISRSASCVIAFLMKTKGLSFLEAISFVTSRRPFIKPNEGFIEQLKQYQILLTGQN